MSGEARLDPYTELHERLAEYLAGRLGEDPQVVGWMLQPPSRREYGDLSFPLMRYARRSGVDPGKVVEDAERALAEAGIDYARLELIGGYLNVRLDEARLAERLASLMSSGWKPRVPPAREAKVIVVEHTSANPIHPLHLGHSRNTSLGDTLARLLAARGHRVNRRFYVDDVGKQVAVAAYGFRILGRDPLEEARRHGVKPDHLVGYVYAVTHTVMDAVLLRKRLEEAQGEERSRLQAELDETMGDLARLKAEDKYGYFDAIFAYLTAEGRDPEAEVAEIMRRYEKGLEPEKTLVRRLAETVLEGFKQSLGRLGVEFDAWDWESDLVWSSRVWRIVEEARRSRYHTIYKGVDALDLQRVVEELVLPDPEARRRFRLPKGFKIPPLILVRSDGTTLYTTRDVAYSIYKFEATGADEVVNVVGADQRLSQLQVRLALLALGYKREALNMLHYDYEMVHLAGVRMRSRRGRLVTLDSILDALKARAVEEVFKRNPDASMDWVEETAEKIAVGALRFALVRTSAPRPVTLDLERISSLEENSGPYLQYTYARASSILRKHGPIDYSSVDPEACRDARRRSLMLNALRYPLVAAKAADDMAPEDLAGYLLGLADEFNSWYQVDTVIHERDPGARECKAMIVELVRATLEGGLTLLGVPALERM